MPYISASIIMQLMTASCRTLEALKKEGEQGRKQINQYTRYLTVALAAFQAYGIAYRSRRLARRVGAGRHRARLVLPHLHRGDAGRRHHVPDVARRADHGPRRRQRHLAHHHVAGIVAGLPSALAGLLELSRAGGASPGRCCIALLALMLAVVAAIVFIERAQRRLLVQYPKRQMGNRMFQGDASHLPLKLNSSGVIPPIFASSLLLLPITVAQFSAGSGAGVAQRHRRRAGARPAAAICWSTWR